MKKSFTLLCTDKKLGAGEWRFRVHEDGLNVLDPDGELVCWIAHADAGKHFQTPSFWMSIKDIILTTKDGLEIHFRPDAEDVRSVRRYLDDAVLAGGHASVKGLLWQGGCGLVGGVALIAACIASILIIAYVLDIPDQQRKWYGRPPAFGVIAGLAMIGWGIYSVFRYFRLSRRLQED